MKRALFLLFCILTFSLIVPAQAKEDNNDARFLVHLLDYLAHDYAGAVSNGQVLSEMEYNEQKEFAAHTLILALEVPEVASRPIFGGKLKELNKLILNKAPEKDVAALARELQAEVLAVTKLPRVPTHQPQLTRGAELYEKNCVSCHGAQFDGKGPAGVALDPPPANFMDEAAMKDKTPFQEFNVIRLGVPGTGMAAFKEFSDDDVWALAFYVLSVRHGESTNQASPLTQAKYLLDQSLEKYRAGDKKEAHTLALKAYLEGIEPIEPRLKADDPNLVTGLEVVMGEVRSVIHSNRPVPELESAVEKAQDLISQTALRLKGNPMEPPVIFAAAAAILLREGFEAVLIILMLLGVLKKTGAHRAEHWVHGGWLAALGVGILTWFFSGWVLNMSGARREMMEAVTSLVAVAVLLFVGFWLHNQTEIGRWKEFLNKRVVAALESKNLLGLAAFSFIAVFREAFETVLFLRALWLEGGDAGKLAMLAGVLSSLVVIFLLAWLFLKFSVKLPLKRLFGASSLIMAGLAVVLTGKGLHSLQETGLVNVTSIPHGIRGELFGLYPTWETTVAQMVVLVGVVILWQFGSRGAKIS